MYSDYILIFKKIRDEIDIGFPRLYVQKIETLKDL